MESKELHGALPYNSCIVSIATSTKDFQGSSSDILNLARVRQKSQPVSMVLLNSHRICQVDTPQPSLKIVTKPRSSGCRPSDILPHFYEKSAAKSNQNSRRIRPDERTHSLSGGSGLASIVETQQESRAPTSTSVVDIRTNTNVNNSLGIVELGAEDGPGDKLTSKRKPKAKTRKTARRCNLAEPPTPPTVADPESSPVEQPAESAMSHLENIEASSHASVKYPAHEKASRTKGKQHADKLEAAEKEANTAQSAQPAGKESFQRQRGSHFAQINPQKHRQWTGSRKKFDHDEQDATVVSPDARRDDPTSKFEGEGTFKAQSGVENENAASRKQKKRGKAQKLNGSPVATGKTEQEWHNRAAANRSSHKNKGNKRKGAEDVETGERVKKRKKSDGRTKGSDDHCRKYAALLSDKEGKQLKKDLKVRSQRLESGKMAL